MVIGQTLRFKFNLMVQKLKLKISEEQSLQAWNFKPDSEMQLNRINPAMMTQSL